MPYQGLGQRHTAIATKQCKHGQVVTEKGFVGTAFKTHQIGTFVDPSSATIADILVTEDFEIQVGGILETPASGALAAAAEGNRVWIKTATNALCLDATAATGDLPVGVVDEVDLSRNPDVVRISAENLAPFLAHV